MPPVIAAIGLAVGYLGPLAATIFGKLLVYTAFETLINSVLKPKDKGKDQGLGSGSEVNFYSTEADQRLVIGYMRVGGMETIPPTLSGNNGEFLNKVLTIAGHEIDSFGSVYFDQKTIPDYLITTVSGNTNDGLVTDGDFANFAWIRRHAGTASQTVDYKLNEADSTAFTSDFRGRGIAYAAIQLKYNTDVFKSIPAFTFDVNGAKVYDPRLDSTQSGGSGSHRYDDSSTWEFSTNNALLSAWYLIIGVGGGFDPATEINWSSVMTAANVCDGLVVIPAVFSSFTDVVNGVHSGNDFYRSGGSAAWDSGTYSTDSITKGTVYGSLYGTGAGMFGLHTSAALTFSMAYGVQFSVGGASIYLIEGGVTVKTISKTPTAGADWAYIDYDGTYIRYVVNGKLERTVSVTTANEALYLNTMGYADGDGVTLNYQPRYTCNGLLFAANTAEQFLDNLKTLVNSMLGRYIYANGIWSIYAGTSQSATMSITKTDWVSPLSIKFDGGIASRFNRMHVWYIDPRRNWQKVECFPQVNSTYKTNDGGRDLDHETDQILCTNEYEAQRKGSFLLRGSRNQITVAGRIPPRFQDLSTWDVVTLPFDDLGWVSKTFRVPQIKINEDGSYDIAATEEQSTDWTDLAANEYSTIATSPLPATNLTTPTEPTNLTISDANVGGTLKFVLGLPVVAPLNIGYRIITSANCGDASVGSTIYDGPSRSVTVQVVDTPMYYWGQSYVGSHDSAYYPNTYGTLAMPRVVRDRALIADPEFSLPVKASSYWYAGDMFTRADTGGLLGGGASISLGSYQSAVQSWYLYPVSPIAMGRLTTSDRVKVLVRYKKLSTISVYSGSAQNPVLLVKMTTTSYENGWRGESPAGGDIGFNVNTGEGCYAHDGSFVLGVGADAQYACLTTSNTDLVNSGDYGEFTAIFAVNTIHRWTPTGAPNFFGLQVRPPGLGMVNSLDGSLFIDRVEAMRVV